MIVPKYSLPEFERRWLVPDASLLDLSACRVRRIEDKYLDGGRLRLRAVSEDGVGIVYKLGKKYESKQVVSVYLSREEYGSLLVLPGAVARKMRYSVAGGALDVYEYPLGGLLVFEIEFESAEGMAEYVPPAFVGEEITANAKYSGFALAQQE